MGSWSSIASKVDVINNKIEFTNSSLGKFAIKKSSELPNTFQEVEYLQSSGSQYIDTAYTSNANGYRVTGTLQFVSGQVSWANVLGAFTNSSQAKFGRYSSTNRWTMRSADDLQSETTWSSGVDYVFDINFIVGSKYLKINGETIITDESTSTYSLPNIYLFTYNRSGMIYSESFRGRLSNVIMYDSNNAVVRQFIPCYCTETVTAYQGTTQTTAASETAGLYDLTENKFYINSGSGSFTAGPDVN